MIEYPVKGKTYKLYIGPLYLVVEVALVCGGETWFKTYNGEQSFSNTGYFCQNAVDIGSEKG